MACGNYYCKSHKRNSHLQSHTLIDVNLIVGSESYGCCNVQCNACGKYSLVALTFEVTTGRVHAVKR